MKIKHLFAAAALGFGGIAAMSFVPIEAEYSAGDRVGTVVKLSSKGFLCKTWEGQLATDAFRAGQSADGTSSGTSNAFTFSVPDESLVGKLQAAQKSGERVKLTYKQILKAGTCTSDTDYYVTAVTPVAKALGMTPVVKPLGM